MNGVRQILMAWLAACLLLGTVAAQDVDPDDVTFTIDKVEMDLSKYQDVYPNAKGFGSGGKEDWLRILIDYTITVDNKRNRNRMQNGYYWLDQVQCDWRVAILGSADKADSPTDRWSVKGKKSVTYANIRVDGQKHRAELFVHPRVLQRYAPALRKGQVVFEVKLRVGGKTRGEAVGQGDKLMSIRELPKTKTNTPILDSEDIRAVDHFFLSRRETPWIWSSEESFEMIVPTP